MVAVKRTAPVLCVNLLTEPILKRFWAKVNKNGPIQAHTPELGPCWVWTAARFQNCHYAMFSILGWPVLAHRMAWLIAHGEDPSPLFVLHRCDNRVCVNPDHLFRGTQADNVHDRNEKGRTAHSKTSGPHLHPERMPRGEASGVARFTEQDVLEIRHLHSQGWAIRAIARQFDTSHTEIRFIVRRRIWKHI